MEKPVSYKHESPGSIPGPSIIINIYIENERDIFCRWCQCYMKRSVFIEHFGECLKRDEDNFEEFLNLRFPGFMKKT